MLFNILFVLLLQNFEIMKTKNFLLSAAFILASCSVNDNFVSSPNDNTNKLSFTVNGLSYSIDPAVTDTVDLMSLSTEFDARISVSNPDRYGTISVNGVQLVNGSGTVSVDRIDKQHFLTLSWSTNSDKGTIYLRTLNSQIPDLIAKGKATSPGHFYLSFVYLPIIEKVDNSGNLLYYRCEPVGEGVDYSTISPGWWDFKKHVFGGTTYYSYHVADPNFQDRGFTGYNPGMRIVTDEHYTPIDTLHLQPSLDGFVKQGDPIDGHDFYMIDRHHYIMSSYILRNGVYAAYLQEVNNGKVEFDWWSTDHADMSAPLEKCFESTAGPDYVHFNSIDILPDGNWLCSFRHISTIAKIDRKGGTGRLLWSLRGTNLEDGADFHGQHYARWHEADSTITLFNNANGVFSTRMLRLTVDLTTGELKKSAVLCDDGYFSAACGALSFSGDNMIVGWGIPGNDAVNNRLLSEYDANGNELFTLCRPTNNINQNTLFSSYRCVKCQ